MSKRTRFSLTQRRTNTSLLTAFAYCGLLLSCSALNAIAQTPVAADPQTSSSAASASLPNAPVPQAEDQETASLKALPSHILKDQAAIWISPVRLRTNDLKWLIPLAAATGVGIATDHHVMTSVVSHDTSFNDANGTTSNVLVGGLLATPVALYGIGHFRQNEHARETGILSGEAAVDGLVVEQGMKLIAWRERPSIDNARGLFFQRSAGLDSSFPSSHCVLTWSAASVLAAEYPSRWSQLGIYSLATGISLTRVLSQQHFPTDVLIGSTAGWLIGHYIYRTHHHAIASH